MPPFKETPPVSGDTPEETIRSNRMNAKYFEGGNMDHANAYMSFSKAARDILEDRSNPDRELWAANLLLGPDPIAKDMSFQILMESNNAEILAGVIATVRDMSILKILFKRFIELPNLSIRDLAIAIEIVPDISGVRSYKDGREERQAMFEKICIKGRELSGHDFVENVALSLSFPSRYFSSVRKAQEAYGPGTNYSDRIFRYLKDNSLYVLGSDSIISKKIIADKESTLFLDLDNLNIELKRLFDSLDLAMNPQLEQRRIELVNGFRDFIRDVGYDRG